MTSRQSSEGSDAIKAAKERLATANAWKKSAEAQKKSADAHKKSVEAQLKSAKEGVKSAETQLRASKNEVKNADAFLKEAYKKWEVIDVDEDEDGVAAASAKGGSDKRKRDGAVSPDSGSEKRKKTRFTTATATSQSLASNGAPSDEVQEIVVEGAGTAEVNGAYKRCTSMAVCELLPSVDMDYPVFSRSGTWEGKATDFHIYRMKFDSCWFISGHKEKNIRGRNENLDKHFYYNFKGGIAGLPPKTSWSGCYHGGTLPAPQLKW